MTDRSRHIGEDAAYRKALRILSHRDHSVTELKNKLRVRDFSDRDIDAAMAKLVRLGLLDDSRFSESFVRERVRHRPMGKKGLVRELVIKRGVSEEIARGAIAAVMDEEGVEEKDLAMSVLRKRGVDDRRKIVDLLRRRGFGEGVISSVLEGGINRS